MIQQVKELTPQEQVETLNRVHTALGGIEVKVSEAKTVLDIMTAIGHVNNSIVKQIQAEKEKEVKCEKAKAI